MHRDEIAIGTYFPSTNSTGTDRPAEMAKVHDSINK